MAPTPFSHRFDAVVFDLDGLLIDSESLWPRAEIEVFARVGVTLTFDDCRETMGMRMDEVAAYWRERKPWDGLSTHEVAEQTVDRVIELIVAEGRAMPAAVSTVERFAASGTPLAVASSSWERLIFAALDVLGLRDAFRVICSAEHEALGKPDPAVYLKACAGLGVDPARALAFEDSVSGTSAAKNAGMRCIAVPYDDPDDPRFPPIADVVVPSLASVTDDVLAQAAKGLD